MRRAAVAGTLRPSSLRANVQGDKTLKINLSRCILLVLVALFICRTAHALENTNPFQSEEAFLAQVGSQAIPVAPGVYRIQVSPYETIEVAFGQQGLDYDRARVQEEITALRSQISQNPSDQKLRRKLRQRLAESSALWEGERDRALSSKAAVTGTVCDALFEFSLDGGYIGAYIGGTAWGQASISLYPIGPPPPPSVFPAHRAYSAVNTIDDSNNTYSQVDTQLVPQGSAAPAQSSASVGCGVVFDCPGWISYNWIYAYGSCMEYRRIYRTKVNPNG